MEENPQAEQINNNLESKSDTFLKRYWVLGVIILGTVINLSIWALLAKKPDFSTSVYVIGLVYFVLLILLLFLQYRVGKLIYILVAIFTLLFSLTATFNYLNNYRHQNQQKQAIIAETQASISNSSGDQLVSGSEEAITTQELKNTEAAELSKLNKKSSVIPLISSYLTAALLTIYVIKLRPVAHVNETQSLDAEDFDQE